MPAKKQAATRSDRMRGPRPDSKRVLLARPKKGEVDYKTLRDKVMSKFSRTLAYLAK